MAQLTAPTRSILARKLPALVVAVSVTLATSGCALFGDGPPPQRDSEAGGSDVISQSSGENQGLWIALLAFLVAGAAAGAAASASD